MKLAGHHFVSTRIYWICWQNLTQQLHPAVSSHFFGPRCLLISQLDTAISFEKMSAATLSVCKNLNLAMGRWLQQQLQGVNGRHGGQSTKTFASMCRASSRNSSKKTWNVQEILSCMAKNSWNLRYTKHHLSKTKCHSKSFLWLYSWNYAQPTEICV